MNSCKMEVLKKITQKNSLRSFVDKIILAVPRSVQARSLVQRRQASSKTISAEKAGVKQDH